MKQLDGNVRKSAKHPSWEEVTAERGWLVREHGNNALTVVSR